MKSRYLSTRGKIIALSIFLGVIFWVVDSFVDFVFFYQDTSLWELLASEVTGYEIYFRGVGIGLFVLFGLILSRVVERRQQAVEELKSSEQRLGAILSNGPIVMMLLDENLHVRIINEGTKRFSGRTVKGTEGLPAGEAVRCIHALDVPEGCGYGPKCHECVIRTTVFDTLKTGEPHHRVAGVFQVDRDGDDRTLDVLVTTSVASLGDSRNVLVYIEDVTDLRRVQRMESLNSRLFGEIPDMVTVIDLQGKIVSANRAACKYLGRAEEDLVGLPIDTVYEVTGDKITLRQIIGHTIAQGEWKGELMNRSPRGTEVVIDSHTWLVHDEIGNPRWICGVSRDVTEQKILDFERRIINSRLVERDELYHQVIANASGVAYRLHWGPEASKGEYEFFGPEIENLVGIPAGELDQEEFVSLIQEVQIQDSAISPDATQRRRDFESGKITRYRADFLIRTPQGESKWLTDCSLPLIEDVTGKIVGSIGILQDITERKRAEADRDRLIAAIEQADESVVITDVNGAIQYVNPAFERITGYTRDEALGQNPKILKSGKHDDAFYREMWKTLTDGTTWQGRIINKSKNGTLFTEDASISPVQDSHGTVVNFIAVKRNVSHEIELEAQLRQAQKMEAIGQLAGGVAHDFNNLLMGILGHSDLALESIPAEGDLHFDITQIKKAGERAAALTRQLLAFSRRQVLNTKDIDFNRVIQGLLDMVGRLIGENIHLEFHAGSGIGIVNADPGQLEQVLLNLIVNARDAMPKGGKITIETGSVEFDAATLESHTWARPGRHSFFRITDTGHGISDDAKQHIFDPFYTTKGISKGTGLGLSIVHGIIQQHGGFIDVQSELGKGTAFTIYLPTVAKAETSALETEVGPAKGGTETILLVEDEENVRSLVTGYLERVGYHVFAAASGEEGVEIFQAHADEIDFALLDMILAGINGREVREQILRIKPTIKCLFMSGYLPKETTEGFHHDKTPILPKPFDSQTLLKEIRHILDA